MMKYEEVFDVCVWLLEKSMEYKYEWRCELCKVEQEFGYISGNDWRVIMSEMLRNGCIVKCKRGLYNGGWGELVIVEKMGVE